MSTKNFKVKTASYDPKNRSWRGSVEFKRVFDNGNEQHVDLDYDNVVAPEGASESGVKDILLSMAKREAARVAQKECN
jgi:hypothetical protein